MSVYLLYLFMGWPQVYAEGAHNGHEGGVWGAFVIFFSERLSIAYSTNPWAQVEETTGPQRVTNKGIWGADRECHTGARSM